MKAKRIFLIVLDSYGIGEMPDAHLFGDEGANTLSSIVKSEKYDTPNLKKLGLFNIDGVDCFEKEKYPIASFARVSEASNGKDTTIGHWEIAGVISEKPLPTYPNGFPDEIISQFERKTGRKVICNKTYSGTDVIRDFGKQHLETGDLIVYTSADSVFQIAAHEEVVPIEKLYEYCKIAREILKDEHSVGRVIARPFIGEYPNFKRTPNRHDYSLLPPKKTMLDYLSENGFDTIGVGKIYDIFAGQGIKETFSIKNNIDGMNITLDIQNKDFKGLCFVNLVDFDMLYGHRNDVDGYANAATAFDKQLEQFMLKMRDDDMLIITADHGCDPGFKGTDHTREYVPLIIYGKNVKQNNSLGTKKSFADIAKTILENFEIDSQVDGQSFLKQIMK